MIAWRSRVLAEIHCAHASRVGLMAAGSAKLRVHGRTNACRDAASGERGAGKGAAALVPAQHTVTPEREQRSGLKK